MIGSYPQRLFDAVPEASARAVIAAAIRDLTRNEARPLAPYIKKVVESRAAVALRNDLLRALHPTGFRELRLIAKGAEPYSHSLPSEDFGGVQKYVERAAGDRLNLYMGVATRASQKGGRASDCLALHTLFVEIDFKETTEVTARAVLGAFPLTPSAIVASGFGLHVYWFLARPFDLAAGGAARAKDVLQALAVALKADKKSAEPARVLRVPGTLNYKYKPPRPVVLEALSEARRYTLEQILEVLPPIATRDEPTVTPGSAVDHGLSTETRKAMARTYLDGQSPAVEGQGGDAHTFQVCCAVAVGHDLDENDTFGVLQDWNGRCEPPWSELELRQKIRNAISYATGRRGEKLLFPRTEMGDAENFAAVFGDRVRYDHRQGRYLVFAGHYWRPDADAQIQRLALNLVRLRQQQAVAMKDDSTRASFVKWALAGESRSRLTNLLALAQSVLPISDSGEGWDSDPWLLGAPNGIVDLRHGELRAGRAGDRMTMAVRTPYDPSARCPRWEQFIAEVFENDAEVIAYVRRALGYSLTGVTREQCLFLCWGDGANGKGTLMNTVAFVVADYADNLPFSALELQDRGGGSNDIAKLVGKRFVTSSETNDNVRLNEARVKALTGCDPITARFLYREFFTFEPAAKFWLATNHKPIVQDDSHGFWRRIHLIPFTQCFTGARDDRSLKDALRAEAPGILRWMVEGCQQWQHDGLNPPDVVRAATEAYRQENDPLSPFFDARCVLDPAARVRASDLFTEYTRWCEEQRKRDRLSQKAFGQRIRKQFNVDEQRQVYYLGIGRRDLVTRSEM